MVNVFCFVFMLTDHEMSMRCAIFTSSTTRIRKKILKFSIVPKKHKISDGKITFKTFPKTLVL